MTAVPTALVTPPERRATAKSRVGFAGRALAAAVSAACLALIATSAWLTPVAAGSGTHMQLGLRPCGWVVAFDKPCVTCGMTTAFAFAAEGDLASAAKAQPMGLALALLTSAGFWAALHVALTGSRLGSICARMLGPRWLWAAAGLAAASWAYKLATWPGG